MAPKAFLETQTKANLIDLQKLDIWSLGMTMFLLLNPNTSHPYNIEMDEQRGVRAIEVLRRCMEQKRLPKHSKKYEDLKNRSWKPLMELFYTCSKFQAKLRPTAENVLQQLVNHYVQIEKLLVSQASVTEAIDLPYVKESNKRSMDTSQSTLNACSFLCILIADKIMRLPKEDVNIAHVTQDVILNFPEVINSNRSSDAYYSIDEAYKVMLTCGAIEPCDFIVELPC